MGSCYSSALSASYLPQHNKQSCDPFRINKVSFLPDRPLEGTGSLSDWMGRAGDLSREAAPVRSHAQLRTHRKERSARGASIPNLPLFLSLRETWGNLCRALSDCVHAFTNLCFSFISECESQPGNFSEHRARAAQRLSSAPAPPHSPVPVGFIARCPDSFEQPPVGRRGSDDGRDG